MRERVHTYAQRILRTATYLRSIETQPEESGGRERGNDLRGWWIEPRNARELLDSRVSPAEERNGWKKKLSFGRGATRSIDWKASLWPALWSCLDLWSRSLLFTQKYLLEIRLETRKLRCLYDDLLFALWRFEFWIALSIVVLLQTSYFTFRDSRSFSCNYAD